ncbi:MAG TPA: ATP-binding protein, partial [Pirellulaceae bacterium]
CRASLAMTDPRPDFYAQLAAILNSEQSRSVVLSGNVHDLFVSGDEYAPLIHCLGERFKTDRLVRVVYEQNGPIRILDDRDKVKNAWISWKAGVDLDTLLLKGLREKGQSELDRLGHEFDQLLLDAIGNPTLALEFLRQLTICSRSTRLPGSLVILIEAADLLLPAGNGDVATLNDQQLRRISICQDWFGDPAFMNGGDSVVMIAESRSLIHPRVARLPQVLTIEIPAPDFADRLMLIQRYLASSKRPVQLWGSPQDLATFTAGLSLHAVRQVLAAAAHSDKVVTPSDLVAKVEEFIQSQVGEDVVEFKKPSHTLEDVIGFSKLKEFLRKELIPRFKADPESALPGAAVAGPIGSGKTFIFEAVAGELGVPVLVLKNVRSQWYGQTDVIFERLRRVLEAIEKVVIFVDEADTQFGGVSEESHSTERRLTGKIQAMMSDPKLRGRVMWLLMTARIHLLSPDIRRPGRVGDLIIPVLDPEGPDRVEFIRWMVKPFLPNPTDEEVQQLQGLTQGYSSAAFASVRSQLKASGVKSLPEALAVIRDQIPPDIGLTRKYQILQALVNCTRRSLLPNPDFTDKDREAWQLGIRELERLGVD